MLMLSRQQYIIAVLIAPDTHQLSGDAFLKALNV
jgi:hypothetical protein